MSYSTADDDGPLSEQDDMAVAAAVHDCIAKSDKASSDWRSEARTHYDMVAGDQWSDEDEATLIAQDRPVVVFNRIGALLDAVCGAQVNNRQETKFLPRTLNDSGGADAWQGVLSYVRDLCDAEDEESEAFRDLTITGMGWLGNRLDYTNDPDGQLVKDRIDPLEMFWDPSSLKKNLADVRWIARCRRAPRDEVKSKWPDYGALQIAARPMPYDTPHSHRARRDDYAEDHQRSNEQDLDTVEVIEYQWSETYTIYVVANPETGAVEQLDAETWGKLGDRLGRDQRDAMRHVTQSKVRWYRAFVCGDHVLERGECPDPQESTFACMTGKRDRNKGTWYGLIRPVVDPQRWANKWLSQSLHIINTAAKSGLMAEASAIEDIRKFEEEYARPGSISMVSDGALSGGRVIPKQAAAFPAGFDKLLQFAIGSIPDVSGINREMLGLVDREQAGVLEWQRKQAGQAVLAPLFDAMRLYNKRDGRQMMRLISRYFPPDKAIRITGEDNNPQMVQMSMLPDFQQYDVIVDQAPTSPNQKMEVWGFLQPTLPALLKMGLPMQVWAELMRYSPLPESAVEKMIKGWQESTQQQGPPPEVQKMQAEMEMKQAELQMKQQQMEAELQLKQQEMAMELQMRQAEMALKVREAEMDMQMQQAKSEQDMQLKRQGATLDAGLKARTAEHKMRASDDDDDGPSQSSAALARLEDMAGQIGIALRQAQQASEMLAERVQSIAETAEAPREIVRGADGRATGVKVGGKVRNIQRGPDGRAVGLQ